MNDKVSSPEMSRTFIEEIQAFSNFWKKHKYCLPADSVEKGIRLLATSSAAFRSQHSPFFLTKLLNVFSVFEHKIALQQKKHPQQRSLFFRLFTRKTESSSLGIAVAIKVNGNTEFLSQERLLEAVLHIVPGVVSVQHKAYHYRDDQAGLLFLYQEIEKKRGRGFTENDIQQLKKLLPKELEENVECYSPSLFLYRNEEEIFRNIVQMSREFQNPDDLPQVTISFQEQTQKGCLRFSVVVVRLITPDSPSLQALSTLLPQTIQIFPEMNAEIGTFDEGHIKQANILSFEVDSGLFTRKNSSIDLREARLYIVKTLELMIGEFRDYNGGIFSKQHKQLRALQETAGNTQNKFLEQLFYSFTPALFQTFILPEAGKACGSLFMEAKKSPLSLAKPFEVFKHHETSFSVVVIKTALEPLKNAIIREVTNFSFPLHQFGFADQFIDGEHYLGLVYQYPTSSEWLEGIEAILTRVHDLPKQERKFLRVNFLDGDPLSLNPHTGLDLRCRSIQKALFEGLTRIAPSGLPELAAARSVVISEDGKTYLFTLRKVQWSNGEEMTAYQFEKTWKKAVRSPSSLRPDFFYILKNARRAHFNQAEIDEIGVKALDKQTLQVTLEHPAPYFLQMLAHPLFFPLYEESGEPYIFSGPFTLHSWKRHHAMVLIKNPYYWDFENVKLEGVEISIIRDSEIALQKFEQGELDWIGGPFSPLPTSKAVALEEKMKRVDTPGVAWLYCNLNYPLLSSHKVRQALSCVLDRNTICKKTLHFAPLETHVPAELSSLSPEEIVRTPDRAQAVALFEEGLYETGCSRDSLTALRLVHSHIPGQKEITMEVQKQWEEAFGIQIQRVEESWNTFSHQLDNRLIHVGSCYRHPFYHDPMYYLQIFYETTNIHNAFGWQSERFNEAVHQARLFPQERSYLKQAERELLEQMPVIPLHRVTYHYIAHSDVQGIYFSHSGDVDFKWIWM